MQKLNSSTGAISLVIHPKEHELGGFSVRRALPHGRKRMIGPWIFFDHIGPATFSPGQGIDVRPHPHINLATVTYLFNGEMLHRDSLGNVALIKPGEINLMVAGKGIVHSERQRDEIKAHGNSLEGLQLWLALPDKDEEVEPQFYHYDTDEIPCVAHGPGKIRVLIGSAYGVNSPVKTYANTLYVEASLNSGESLELPGAVEELGVYVVRGRLGLDDAVLDQYTMTVINTQQGLAIRAIEDAQIAIIGGERLPTRHIWWNFVSSRKQRIEQARRDWLEGAFAKIPGDDIEFIPLPED
jgi:redox-sensitive bicupin YhaK (pirin superfamily)